MIGTIDILFISGQFLVSVVTYLHYTGTSSSSNQALIKSEVVGATFVAQNTHVSIDCL